MPTGLKFLIFFFFTLFRDHQNLIVLFLTEQWCFFLQSLMIASIPNIIGWLAISFAKVGDWFCSWIFYFTPEFSILMGCSVNGCICFLSMQDSSFLYMGRLLEGFGVGVISYTVCLQFFNPKFSELTKYTCQLVCLIYALIYAFRCLYI